MEELCSSAVTVGGKNGNAMFPFLTIAHRTTPPGNPLVPLRNGQMWPFGHIWPVLAILTDSGGPSLPPGRKWPEYREVARMATFGVLASQMTCQIEKRALFDVKVRKPAFGEKSNGEILTF